MRIAFVTNVVYPYVKGGAEKRVDEIGSRLANRGHDVTVYGRNYWGSPETIERDGMTLRGIAPRRDLYTESGRRSIGEALDFGLRTFGPIWRRGSDHDVVVASAFPYFPVIAASAAVARTETPLVTTWHEVWLDYWEDYLGTLASGGKLIERATANVPQRPVAVSGVTADRLARIGPAREEIAVVPNGIDFERIRATPPADGGFDVLFVGRLIEDKRVDLLLAAFDRIAGRHDVRLGIVGEGPARSDLESKRRGLEHVDRVTFTGFLDDDEDVVRHLHAARVFASPSTREGFGITLVEAMAAGCTVIAADHPESAASEVVGDAGFLVSPTVTELAEALDRALSDERPRSDPVEAAKRFDWDSITDDAETVYRDAVEANR